MKKIWVIAWKELRTYFVLPSAYVICIVFILFSGIFFYNHLSIFFLSKLQSIPWAEIAAEKDLNHMIIQPYFNSLSILYLLIPVITMRLFAEEKRLKTEELLYSSPISSVQIVLGKYLAAVILFFLLIIFTMQHVIFVCLYGNPDIGPIISGYIGLFLVGLAYISIGLLCSAFTDNQIIAAILTFGVICFFWMIGLAQFIIASPAVAAFFRYFSLQEHFHTFTKGLIELKDVVYVLSFAFIGLFLAYQTVEYHRWK